MECHRPESTPGAAIKANRRLLFRPANYSDPGPGPKTRPNLVIRIFELSLYYAGLNRTA
jgi:hypothetical protein